MDEIKTQLPDSAVTEVKEIVKENRKIKIFRTEPGMQIQFILTDLLKILVNLENNTDIIIDIMTCPGGIATATISLAYIINTDDRIKKVTFTGANTSAAATLYTAIEPKKRRMSNRSRLNFHRDAFGLTSYDVKHEIILKTYRSFALSSFHTFSAFISEELSKKIDLVKSYLERRYIAFTRHNADQINDLKFNIVSNLSDIKLNKIYFDIADTFENADKFTDIINVDTPSELILHSFMWATIPDIEMLIDIVTDNHNIRKLTLVGDSALFDMSILHTIDEYIKLNSREHDFTVLLLAQNIANIMNIFVERTESILIVDGMEHAINIHGEAYYKIDNSDSDKKEYARIHDIAYEFLKLIYPEIGEIGKIEVFKLFNSHTSGSATHIFLPIHLSDEAIKSLQAGMNGMLSYSIEYYNPVIENKLDVSDDKILGVLGKKYK